MTSDITSDDNEPRFSRFEFDPTRGQYLPSETVSMPDWYRLDLENEYRALMQRLAWLKKVLGKGQNG